ncbi:MAG: hypothetical protein AB1401_00515 [Thermodesulfobacteriota bacterium]
MGAENIELGYCEAKYNNIDLGLTKGGCVVTITPNLYEITVDKYGKTPIDDRDLGYSVKATVPLVEKTLSNLKVAFPFGDLSGGKLKLGGKLGGSIAKYELNLHPAEMDAGDKSRDVTIYKAASVNEVAIGHTNEGERIIQVTFKGYIDTTRPKGDQLVRFGLDGS